jgi:hypothetical protein
MTEQEWLGSTYPEPMLEFLRGNASERKFRLFACACCRRICFLLNAWSQNVVETSEQYLDGLVGTTALAIARNLHADASQGLRPYTAQHIAKGIVDTFLTGAAWPLAWNAVSGARRAIRHDDPKANILTESENQAALVRDIFGNPFRPVATDPLWFAWRDRTISRLAQAFYNDRRLSDLPILGDALEDAGCSDESILAHCRQPGDHFRGCWVVDLILGRK